MGVVYFDALVTDMNKRRNDDVMSQLGDPLPLPYKLKSSEPNLNLELVNSKVLYQKPSNDSVLRTSETDDKTKIPEFIKLNRLRPNPIRRQFVRKQRDIDLINSIEAKLEYLKQLIEENQLSSSHLGFLQDIRYQLDTLLEKDNEQVNPDFKQVAIDEIPGHSVEDSSDNPNLSPIMNELERLQSQARLQNNTSPGSLQALKTKRFIMILLLCTLIYLSSSYYVSGLRYEYCYYYC